MCMLVRNSECRLEACSILQRIGDQRFGRVHFHIESSSSLLSCPLPMSHSSKLLTSRATAFSLTSCVRIKDLRFSCCIWNYSPRRRPVSEWSLLFKRFSLTHNPCCSSFSTSLETTQRRRLHSLVILRSSQRLKTLRVDTNGRLCATFSHRIFKPIFSTRVHVSSLESP
jgi:hypothetical protein